MSPAGMDFAISNARARHSLVSSTGCTWKWSDDSKRKHAGSKVSPEDRRDIDLWLESGEVTQTSLARLYGVAASRVSQYAKERLGLADVGAQRRKGAK